MATLGPEQTQVVATSPSHRWTVEPTNWQNGDELTLDGKVVYVVNEEEAQSVEIRDPIELRSGPWKKWLGFGLINQTEEAVFVYFWSASGERELKTKLDAGQFYWLWSSPDYVYSFESEN